MCDRYTALSILLKDILIQMLMAAMNVHVLFPSLEMKIPYIISTCFYFTDCKLLCQRFVAQGNVLGVDAKRNQ